MEPYKELSALERELLKLRTPESERIDNELLQDQRERTNKLSLLLLGTPDSGKSTLMKQVRVDYLNGYSEKESEGFRDVLRFNCLKTIQLLCAEAKRIGATEEGLKPELAALKRTLGLKTLTLEAVDDIEMLWPCPMILRAFMNSHLLSLPGGAANAEYFLQNARRFATKDYVPTQDDIVRSKVTTTGYHEVKFTWNTLEVSMVDMGGQRTLDEFDMVLEEDGKTNRMEESLKVFQRLTGGQWLENMGFILLLNKSDKFKAKIRDFFEDYDLFCNSLERRNQMDDFEKSCEYIKAQYIDAFHGSRLYPFITCFLDTKVASYIMASVRDIVITGALTGAGL